MKRTKTAESKIKFEVGRVYECASLMLPGNAFLFKVIERTKVNVILRELSSGKIIKKGLERKVQHEAEQLYPFGRRVGRPILSAANVVETEEKQENEVE